jgi:hypothetical protein
MKRPNGEVQLGFAEMVGATSTGRLPRTSLVREIYRSLLSRGRTYGAFRSKDREFVELLSNAKEIFDPMSGYGGLMAFCSERGLGSYSLELNPPQYFWQVLRHPRNTERFLGTIDYLKVQSHRWTQPLIRAVAFDDFFPAEAQTVLLELFEVVQQAVNREFGTLTSNVESAVALLLPFVGRLACTAPGDTSVHAKRGGICVLRGWPDDFRAYLECVAAFLCDVRRKSAATDHVIQLGDARTFKFPRGRFRAMVTSPPYPNSRNFATLFRPENSFLTFLQTRGLIDLNVDVASIIGSTKTHPDNRTFPQTPAALAFLKNAAAVKRTRAASYDDEVYYFPYFRQYFADLESAFDNIARALNRHATGYIVVVNNTHRGLIVPVVDVVLQKWKSLNFAAAVATETETFHLGTKNPRARGFRARHTEYVVRINR